MAELSTKRILTMQEEKLVSLRKQHKTLLKKISTERTKLTRLKGEIKRIMSSSAGAMQSKMQALHNAQKEMQNVLERCAQSTMFSKSERKDFYWMKEDLGEMFGEMMPPEMSEAEFAEFMRQQAEERGKAGFDFFNHFAPDVPEEQQKSIREVYKRLAAKFHPDKAARNAEVEKRFHNIMQRINAAYQHGDIAELLALEAEFADIEDILSREESPLRDLVEQEMERLRAEVELCNAQLHRIKDERKKIERTDEGRIVKDFKKAEKIGLDPMQEMTREIDTALEELLYQKSLYERVLSGEITKKQMMNEMDKHSQSRMMSFAGEEFSEEEFFSMVQEAAEAMFSEMEMKEQQRRARGSSHQKNAPTKAKKNGRK
jgi:hypothetical protein